MKSITVKLNNDHIEILKKISSEEKLNQSDIIRKALEFYAQREINTSKELVDIKSKNQQLSLTVQSMKMVLDEKEIRLQEKDEKYAVLEVVQREQANVYQTILKQKDDLLTEIKNMSMWKRAFLKLA